MRRNLLVWECVAPIAYKGQAAISKDIDNFKSALKGVSVTGAFMPVAAPMSARGLWLNAYYKTDEEIVVALADALKEEYKAIVDAGFILQLDDAFLAHEYDRLRGEMSKHAVHKYAERCVDLTNYALTAIPQAKCVTTFAGEAGMHRTPPTFRLELYPIHPQSAGPGLFIGKRKPAA